MVTCIYLKGRTHGSVHRHTAMRSPPRVNISTESKREGSLLPVQVNVLLQAATILFLSLYIWLTCSRTSLNVPPATFIYAEYKSVHFLLLWSNGLLYEEIRTSLFYCEASGLFPNIPAFLRIKRLGTFLCMFLDASEFQAHNSIRKV